MTDISVIIPTWNSAATLEKAIRSALGQTRSPLEVLVCDDGSTDESQKIVDSINDSRVRWIEGKLSPMMRNFQNASCGRPRNRGIQVSRGEWLAFLDSDDEWLPEKLEKQLAHANKMRCDAVCSNAIRYVPSQGHLGAYYKHALGEVIQFPAFLQSNYIICSSVLIRKDIVDKCKGFPEDRTLLGLEDYALWLRAATFTDFAFINKPLLIYRDEPEESVRAHGATVCGQRINVLRSFISWAYETDYENNKQYLKLAKRVLWRAHGKNVKTRLKKIYSKLKIGLSNENPTYS